MIGRTYQSDNDYQRKPPVYLRRGLLFHNYYRKYIYQIGTYWNTKNKRIKKYLNIFKDFK